MTVITNDSFMDIAPGATSAGANLGHEQADPPGSTMIDDTALATQAPQYHDSTATESVGRSESSQEAANRELNLSRGAPRRRSGNDAQGDMDYRPSGSNALISDGTPAVHNQSTNLTAAFHFEQRMSGEPCIAFGSGQGCNATVRFLRVNGLSDEIVALFQACASSVFLGLSEEAIRSRAPGFDGELVLGARATWRAEQEALSVTLGSRKRKGEPESLSSAHRDEEGESSDEDGRSVGRSTGEDRGNEKGWYQLVHTAIENPERRYLDTRNQKLLGPRAANQTFIMRMQNLNMLADSLGPNQILDAPALLEAVKIAATGAERNPRFRYAPNMVRLQDLKVLKDPRKLEMLTTGGFSCEVDFGKRAGGLGLRDFEALELPLNRALNEMDVRGCHSSIGCALFNLEEVLKVMFSGEFIGCTEKIRSDITGFSEKFQIVKSDFLIYLIERKLSSTFLSISKERRHHTVIGGSEVMFSIDDPSECALALKSGLDNVLWEITNQRLLLDEHFRYAQSLGAAMDKGRAPISTGIPGGVASKAKNNDPRKDRKTPREGGHNEIRGSAPSLGSSGADPRFCIQHLAESLKIVADGKDVRCRYGKDCRFPHLGAGEMSRVQALSFVTASSMKGSLRELVIGALKNSNSGRA